MPLGHLAPQNSSRVPHFSVQLNRLLLWILVGLRRGGQKPHLATIPWGPALGAPGSFFSLGPKGQAGPGCRIWQVGAGGGRAACGAPGGDLGWHRIPRLRVGPRGGAALATWLPEQLQTGEWSSQGPESSCGHTHTHTHTHIIPEAYSDQITVGHPLHAAPTEHYLYTAGQGLPSRTILLSLLVQSGTHLGEMPPPRWPPGIPVPKALSPCKPFCRFPARGLDHHSSASLSPSLEGPPGALSPPSGFLTFAPTTHTHPRPEPANLPRDSSQQGSELSKVAN